ncbi:MAG: vWA domain-containing protein, partial [Cyanobacteria bacterium P01_D01_bin.116]
HFASGGQFKISTLSGEPGNFVSLFDPIIFSQGDVELGDYTGASLHILAGGSVTAGDIEITGTSEDSINPNNTNLFNPNNPDSSIASLANVTLSDGSSVTVDGSQTPTLDIRAGVDWDELGGLPQTIDSVSPNPSATLSDSATDSSITVGDVTISSSTGDKGSVFLTNQFKPNQNLNSGEIKTGLIDSGSLAVDSRSSISTSAFPFTVTGEATIQSTGQTTTLSLSSPTLTSKDRITLTANINPGEFTAGEEYNVAFVIDVSRSTRNDFDDIDGNGEPDTVLDAEIAAFSALNQSIIASNIAEKTTVGVIDFDGSARLETFSSASVDSDNNGTPDVEDRLNFFKERANDPNSNFSPDGTNFNAALETTIDFFDDQVTSNRNNLVFFVSDGFPEAPVSNPNIDPNPSQEQITRLTNDFKADITALGILANNITDSQRTPRLETLQILDPNAELVEDPSSLQAGLTGGQIDPADVQEVKILVNGNLAQTLSKGQLETSGSGLKFNSDITGLKPGDNNVEVQVVFDDPNDTQVNATQKVEVITAQTLQKNAPEPLPTSTPTPSPTPTSNPEKQVPQLQTPNQQLPRNPISQLPVDTLVEEIEQAFTEQFIELAGDSNVPIKTVQDTKGLLSDIAQRTGVKPAAVYTTFLPEKYVPGSSLVRQNKDSDLLNIIIVTAEGKPIRKQIKGATRGKVLRTTNRFVRELSNPRRANSTRYLTRAKQ